MINYYLCTVNGNIKNSSQIFSIVQILPDLKKYNEMRNSATLYFLKKLMEDLKI